MTAAQAGTIIPVEITVYQDRSFTFITKTPPAAALVEESGGHRKRAAANPLKTKVGSITEAQLRELAEAETAGFERQRRRRRHEDSGGHGAFDGH